MNDFGWSFWIQYPQCWLSNIRWRKHNIHPNASCQKPPLLRRCSPKYSSSSKFRDIKFMDTIWVISGLMNDYRNQLPDQRATLICCSTRVLKSNLIVNALPWLPERLEKSMEKWGIHRDSFRKKRGMQTYKTWRIEGCKICQSDSFLIPTRLLQTLRAAAKVFSGKKNQDSPTANKEFCTGKSKCNVSPISILISHQTGMASSKSPNDSWNPPALAVVAQQPWVVVDHWLQPEWQAQKTTKPPRFSAQDVGWHSMISATTGWTARGQPLTKWMLGRRSFPFLFGFWWLFRGYVVFHFQGVFQSPKSWSCTDLFSLWMDHSQVSTAAISWLRETIPNRHRIAKAFPALARRGCCSSDVRKGTQLSQPWNIWMFPKIVVPQNGWFIMENPIKMDDLGGKPTIFGNIHIQYSCNAFAKHHHEIIK